MKDRLVTFETAWVAYHKGYSNTQDRGCWIITKKTPEPKLYENKDDVPYLPVGCSYIDRPTQSMLQKWLRDKHDIHLCIEVWESDGANKYEVTIMSNLFPEDVEDEELFDTYEEALEKGLKEALKLI